ncbi:MAG: lactonase family protein [Lachnospiraceae bacterium]|nr:lactonase family protein [Lachnospiraceae bacterium]
MSKTYIYISRWDEFVGEPGLVKCEYVPETGEMKDPEIIDSVLRLNHMVINREKNVLYINNEIGENPDFFKGGGGLIYAYSIDPKTGDLTQISRVPACCPCPSYLSLDPTGNYLICANHSGYNAVTKAVQLDNGTWGMQMIYDDATIDLFELNADGSIGDLVDVSKHTGLNPKFLLHAHPHCAVWDPSGRFFAACDKGEDNIRLYRINYADKKLEVIGSPYRDKPFSAPRYCVFHPEKPFLYVNHEQSTVLTSFRYGTDGSLEPVCSVNVLPDSITLPDMKGKSFKSFKPGEKPAQQSIAISSDGRFIYDVINGKDIDGISVFATDHEGGMRLIQYIKADGVWARGLVFAPDEKTLVLTCMDREGSVLTYMVNADGTLSPTGQMLKLPGAAFAAFYSA